MGWFEAIILGLVQGLTEFLPISSSAHLRIAGEFLGTGADPGAAFTAIIQLGTETAVLVYFLPDIAHIVSSWFKALVGRIPRTDPNARLGWFIIVGSIPIVVLGLLFQHQIETVLRSLWIVAATMIVFGILLGLADYLGAKTLRLREMSWRHALLLGLAQSLALIPGVSRSGATIGAGRALGYERRAAARYSFLLALPAVFGSGLYELYKTLKDPCDAAAAKATGCAVEVFTMPETIAATLVAGVVGFVVIAFLMRYISKGSFLPFVIYRLVLGVALIVLLSTGVLQA
ncbi:undecaprenyl-diphosphate phosphatase [Lysinimonas soli]|uniref:Undecaprenyl-diphosphatase n=1 Tax=Lysinimonas soli TaxID=1074233 RepID=A0ABW0NNG1_9MICO